MKVDGQSSEPTTESDPLPEGTEHCVMVCQDVTVTKAKRYAEHLPDELDLDGRTGPFNSSPSVTFEPGDEVPLPIARDCWKAFGDKVGCLDENGTRVDRKSEIEEKHRGTAQRAIQEFQRSL